MGIQVDPIVLGILTLHCILKVTLNCIKGISDISSSLPLFQKKYIKYSSYHLKRLSSCYTNSLTGLTNSVVDES